jgi:hypothetical protein
LLGQKPGVFIASQGYREFWIMTAVATQSAPQYVQQSFLFDDVESQQTSVATKSRVAPKMRSGRPAVTVPAVSSTTSARRGRCEHVGGILASVLEKYGIGIDQLIAEIDGVK